MKKILLFFVIIFLVSCSKDRVYKNLFAKGEYKLFLEKALNDITLKVSSNDYAYPVFIKSQNFNLDTKHMFLIACFLGNLNLVKYIYPNIDNMDFSDDEGFSSISYAIFSKNPQVVKYILTFLSKDELLKKNDYNSNLLQLASAVGDLQTFKLLNDLDIFDLDYKNYSHDSALHLASYYGNLDIVKELDILGAQFEKKNIFGYSPFLYSLYSSNIDLIDYIYKKTLNKNDKNMYKDNALIIACKQSNFETIKYILNTLNIDDVNYQNMYGQTPLMILAAKSKEDAFELLMLKKPNLSLLDNQKRGINYYASLRDNKNIRLILKQN